MHRRIVAGVSAVLFALTAVLASIVTDLHDRALPAQLGASAALSLDFSKSGMSDREAFQELGDASDRLELGLVKVSAELSGDQSGQVFVALGQQDRLPETVHRFGSQPDAPIRDSDSLANSYATGQYLLTGDAAQVEQFRDWLTTHQIGQEWSFDTIGSSLRVVLTQGSFAMSLLAAAVLMVVLGLYWLSVKAKGRALRVLAGASTWRIQYEDLAGFLLPILAAAAVCDAIAVVYIGLAHGWLFVPYYVMVLLMLEAILIAITMICALVMSVVSWPSSAMLAARVPAVKSLRTIAAALKAASFVLVIAAVAPAVAAFNESAETAAQQATWKSLADQVSIGFRLAEDSDGLESGFEQLMSPVGELIMDAQEQDAAALSYAWGPDYMDTSPGGLGPYESLALVNPKWLELMGIGREDESSEEDSGPRLTSLSPSQVPEEVKQFLGSGMELWARSDVSADDVLQRVSFYEYSGPETISMAAAGGSGELLFLDNVIVALVEDLHVFDDSFLLSVASSSNLSFTGLAPMQQLLAQHGLQDKVRVQYIAEEGILQAQFTSYFAWLQGIALVALTVALVISAVIGAFITAVLKARRDFPLRLAGLPWRHILAGRIGAEWLTGGLLAAAVITVMAISDAPGLALIAAVAAGGLLLSPLAHLLAARWSFTTINQRKL